MKIYIETDMEGASGVWKATQVSPESPQDYEYGKRCLVRDVNAVVHAAFANGATQVIVRDGHGPAGLNWDQVDPRATVERAGPRPEYFPSLDGECDGVFMVGCHAMAGTPKAFLEHTQCSRTWFDFKINGQSQGEVGQLAAYAGHYGVPVALVAGDRAVCQEMAGLFPDIVTAEVKYAFWRKFCSCHPAGHCEGLLRQKTAEAMDKVRARKVKPWVLGKPVRLELTVQRIEVADDMDQSFRVGPRTFRKEVEDQRQVLCI